MNKEQIQEALEQLPLREKEVRVGGRPGQWLAVVISADYEGVPDHKRQSDAWGALLNAYGMSVSREVEFVYTFSRAEVEEMESQAANDELIAQAAAGS
jgi:acid stress-induced BolA-like protein IbaG/YrbA